MTCNARKIVMLALTALPASSCSSTGPIEAPRPVCALIGGVIGGGTAGAVADNQTDEDNNVALAAIGGTVLGGIIGAAVCGREPQPPRAAVSTTPASGDAPLRVSLTGSGSDTDGRVVGYAWDFGDGTQGKGPEAMHVYEKPGRYRVKLTVTDDDGLTASVNAVVDATAEVAAQPPTPARIVLQGINFAFDSAEIRPEDAPLLDVAAEQLRSSADVRLVVVGHTDDKGSDEYNQGLSMRRAGSVAEYLGRNGIAAERIDIAGRGESEPVTSNATEDGCAQNRRVELNLQP
jgi:OmpA-OmpF porin, OOP family